MTDLKSISRVIRFMKNDLKKETNYEEASLIKIEIKALEDAIKEIKEARQFKEALRLFTK